jgi:hypothetical protein
MTRHGKEKRATSQPFSHPSGMLWVDTLIILLQKRQGVWYPISTFQKKFAGF